MFIEGANRHLLEAMRLGLDESEQLEAQFYRLSHTSSDPAEILQVTKSLLTRGARLRWNVLPNIETVSRREPQKAELLGIVSKVNGGRAGSCVTGLGSCTVAVSALISALTTMINVVARNECQPRCSAVTLVVRLASQPCLCWDMSPVRVTIRSQI